MIVTNRLILPHIQWPPKSKLLFLGIFQEIDGQGRENKNLLVSLQIPSPSTLMDQTDIMHTQINKL